jgi:hypothetical protein
MTSILQNCADHVSEYYSYRDTSFKNFHNVLPDNVLLFNSNRGIGDSLMLFLFDKTSQNTKNIQVLYDPCVAESFKKFNEYIYSIRNNKPTSQSLFICDLQNRVKYPGHFLQNIQYCLGIDVQDVPKAILNNNQKTIKNRVVMTFDRGAHGAFQTNIHPRPRMLYEETKNIIEKFIDNNQHKYEFIEVGRHKSDIKGTIDQTNLGIEKTTDIIGSCDYFFGIHNGLMHIATAFDKKCIIIVNFPNADQIVLPMLSKTDSPDIDWLYPQNVHLHQDSGAYLVPKLSYFTIEKAFNHEIYPFFNYGNQILCIK